MMLTVKRSISCDSIRGYEYQFAVKYSGIHPSAQENLVNANKVRVFGWLILACFDLNRL